MIYVRIARGVFDHFPARRSEWALAGMLASTGLILLLPDATFRPDVPLFRTLSRLGTEDQWGWACFIFGVARLIALIINGTFADTVYSRYSPHVRGVFAFFSCFYWGVITIGLLSAYRPLFALGCYPFLLLLDFSNIWQAFHDAGEVDRSAKRNASIGI